MNNENNNFSLIRNAEINRIGPNYIGPIYYDKFDIHNEMKKMDAYEDEKYMYEDHTIIWKRDPEYYNHKFCNLLVNTEYETTFCIMGIDALLKHKELLTNLCLNNKNDFIVLDNKNTIKQIWEQLDSLGFDKMKCYCLLGESEDAILRYFTLCYLTTDKYEILS